jgi:predicted DNA-binding transcriptional regulator AlpA
MKPPDARWIKAILDDRLEPLSFDNAKPVQQSGSEAPQREEDVTMNAVREFEFLFVVGGVSVDDDHATAVLSGDFDGVLSSNRGRNRYAVAGPGTDSVDAARTLVTRLTAALPALRVCHLDPDLVGIPDIAHRTGHSRQNVLQWVNGERNGSSRFPAPEGTAGRSLVWRWADVNGWLTPLGLGDGAVRPTRAETALIDVMLLAPATLPASYAPPAALNAR